MIKKIVKIGKYPFDNPNEMNNYMNNHLDQLLNSCRS